MSRERVVPRERAVVVVVVAGGGRVRSRGAGREQGCM